MAGTISHEEIHGGLSLTRFAEVTAALRHYPASRIRDVLAAYHVTEADWKTASASWNQAIEQEAERGEDELVVAFAEAMQNAKKAEIPALSELPPEAPPVQATGAGVAPMPPGSSPWALGSSVAQQAPLAVPTGEEVPKQRKHRPVPATTAVLEQVSPPGPALPFLPATAASPFAARPLGKPSTPASLRDTKGVDGAAIRKAVLPFVGANSAKSSSNRPPSSTPARDSSATESGTHGSAAPAVAAAPRLTPEHYVSLTAELAVLPGHRNVILARYGIASEAGLAALRQEWDARFANDRALQTRCNELYAHYYAWFAYRGS